MAVMSNIIAGLKKAISDKTLSNLKDYHIPVMIFMFVCGIPLAWFDHLTMAFVAFTGTIVGGITGHAFSSAWRDKDGDASPDSTSTTASGSSDSK